ncbi:hypothetical protein C0989_000839 [Termitomyces sp. Mn162]|nr:hypothetical protein C0989_000839 [Termitomyces sp. Mn162]
MFTPGFDRENETKPQIVREIEGTDDGMTADQAALALFKGVESGRVHITGDLITSLFRSSTRGAAPHNNWILDGLYDLAAFIVAPIWRSSVDTKVISYRQEHKEYLRRKGYFS